LLQLFGKTQDLFVRGGKKPALGSADGKKAGARTPVMAPSLRLSSS
jgi:hypothetical protein